jgi:hypothetical protein
MKNTKMEEITGTNALYQAGCIHKHEYTIYGVFTDKVERNCHFPAPGRNCYNVGKLILLLYGMILHSYRENLVALGGESCSSSQEPGSDICFPVYQ